MKNIFIKLKEQNRIGLIIILSLSVLLTVLLIAFRIHYTGKVTYAFLVWNLFLALIPFGISSLTLIYHERVRSKLILFTVIFSWLLFFPNAPYIVTDFFHLKDRGNIPYWYDLGLLVSAAWNGLMLGFISLYDMQQVINKLLGKAYGWFFAMSSIVLGSFGIYLGRYQRFNSWEVLTNPLELFADIAGRFLNPFAHPRTMFVTLLFSAFLSVGYLTFLQITGMNRKKAG